MKIGIIGSGKLARVIATACIQEKMQLNFVYSKTKSRALKFAQQFNTQHIEHIEDIPKNLDCYFICVNDDSILAVAKSIQVNGLVIHFSGSQSIDLLNIHAQYGVIWPIQSFSNGTFNSLKEIPVLIEANSLTSEMELRKIANKLSNTVLVVSENERKLYHLAATFVNNFSNHLYTNAAKLLQNNNLNFELMLPILKETVRKIETLPPFETQTGPAIRHDQQTIQTHLDLLKDEPNAKEIYQVMTLSIQNIHG